jgi:hypothetical protein
MPAISATNPLHVRHIVPLLVVTAMMASAAMAQVPIPTVEGPVTGGAGVPFVAGTTFDLAEVGYTQAEYFLSGTASAYTSDGPLSPDGAWVAEPAGSAEYKTRIVVYRPAKRRKFNGTVIVEWLNVSGGLDAAPDWIMMHTELVRRGYAYVGVSVQRVGIEEGGSIVGLPSMPLKEVDPVRYGSLHHPGDAFSYDMFSQAGQLIRTPGGDNPLGDLKVQRLLAVGESQSAFRMVTYVNAIDPLAQVYDGFFVHSRGAGAAPLSEAPEPVISAPASSPIRDDVRVPVMVLQTETDLIFLRYFFDRQPDAANLRVWEVAGTAHADTYTVAVGMTDLGKSPDAAAILVTATPLPGIIECQVPINSGPQHFVVKAALDALHRWVRKGKAPPTAPPLEVTTEGGLRIERDEHGNSLGGIRTPYVDAPIAALSGSGQTGSILCLLFGTTVPLDADTLATLYPKKKSYPAAVRKTLKPAVKGGFILKKDAKLIKKAAKAAAAELPN